MSSKKHIMLSYQWDNQKLVAEVYRRLNEKKIPLWMDIQGGMKGHLSESMAAGVENAVAICCFLTPKYQDSVACKDELTYAKEQGVCIIPIRLIANWKPTGWLGFTITGHKWIDFRDIDTNMDLRIQQLINEIRLLVGNKLDCFKDMEPLDFMHDKDEKEDNEEHSSTIIEEQEFDSTSYYRLTTQWQGNNKSLDVVNDGKNNNQLILATTGNYSGQYWKITPTDNGFYRLTTQWQGDKKSLDIVNDGKNNNQLILATTGNYSGQSWKITPTGNGFYRLTTQWQGDDKSFSVVKDGKNNNQLILAKTSDCQEQYWKITKV
ncbi:unnamed protein product [Rotaria sordida]|uniref:TIR domain-containing protein n=1 Tax=Rotaria sordida TaxID=392033 RepID=A0A818UVM2_9BILA|nr:unnamed protein product [Rotaria sordida]CAF1478984.1 unnamed protein product [Rotaria sordida]CAF3703493.1 unnamed protein product [Rotaria sordida]CAF4131831.1 unnamed protein product [Rotaria sordida]